MSDASQVNPPNRNADDHVIKPAEIEQPGESSKGTHEYATIIGQNEENDELHHYESGEQKDKQKEDEDEDEDEDDEKAISFIKKRRFSFYGMSQPQRLISVLAIGQLLASAMLILFNLIPQSLILKSLILVPTPGSKIGIPNIVFIAAFIFYILAWSFLLSGALHGYIWMRILVLGAFSYVLLLTPAFGFMIPVRIILLTILWIWGLVIWQIERRQAQQTAKDQDEPSTKLKQDVLIRPDWGLYLPTLLPILGLLILYNILYLAYSFWLTTTGIAPSQALQLFYGTVEIYMRALTFLLIPVLFLAGTDFAELGEAIARSGGTLIEKFHTRSPWPLALVLALFSLLIIDRSMPTWTMSVGDWLAALFSQLAIGAIIIAILGVVVYLLRLRRWPLLNVKRSTLRIKTRLLVLATMLTLIFGIFVPGAVAVLQSYTQHPVTPAGTRNFITFQQVTVQPNFSFAYPSNWMYTVTKNNTALTSIVFVAPITSPYGDFVVERYQQGGNSFVEDLSQFLSKVCTPACTISFLQITSYGQWQVLPFTGQGKEGIAWMRDFNGQHWLLLGITNTAHFHQAEPLYTTIVNSWDPAPVTGQAVTTQIDSTVNQASSILLLVIPLLTALLLAMPFLVRRRKQPDFLAVGALFFLVLGMVNLGSRLPDVVAILFPQAHFHFGLSSILLTVSIATLLFLGWLFFTRKITAEYSRLLFLLLVLNGGLGFITLMYSIYGLALHSGLEGTRWIIVLQALLLIVALGWDIFTSGEITNKGGTLFPRHTRLLLFLGYTMLVATAVLYFTSQKTPAGVPLQELFFDSENWPQFGLLVLGVPLVITTFILQVTYWWGSRDLPAGEEK